MPAPQPAVAPSAPATSAPQPAVAPSAPATPAPQPVVVAPSTPPSPALQPVTAPAAPPPPAPQAQEGVYVAPYDLPTAPAAFPPSYPAQGAARRVRYASPRLHPVEPRPPRRYGDAGAPFAFGIGAGLVWRDDVGYELFRKKDYTSGLELFASYDVWAPSTGFVVSFGLDFRTEAHSGQAGLELAHHSLQAELNARFMLARWLWPHVRAAGGFVATRFAAKDELAGISYEDRDFGYAANFGGGLTLRTPARLFETYRGRLASLSLGVLVEGGYMLANAASLTAKPTRASDIERVTFKLGELERGGPYLRILGVVRF